MKNYLRHLAFFIALFAPLAVHAAEKAKPVRMGCGIMTFDTVPGWGLRPDGQSALGPTHGGVVVDKAGNIYVSANKGVVVFSPDGKVIKEYLGRARTRNIHDMKIREEGGDEFIYGARNNNAEGIKFNAHTGEIVLEAAVPRGIGAGAQRSSTPRRSPSLPTATSFCPTATPATTSSSSTRPAST